MKTKIIFLSLLFLSSCVSNQPKSRPGSLTVMTYNVENLFDLKDDPDKEDETYLPIEQKRNLKHRNACNGIVKDHWRRSCLELDWSEAKLKRKLKRLAEAILQVRDGKGPDLLILQEVENKEILERLRTEYLAKAGYLPSILLEGPDQRGIDVGMLSRLPVSGEPKLHTVTWKQKNKKTGVEEDSRPTRGILQARFQLPDGRYFTAFGLHFPSQGAPVVARHAAVDALIKAKKALPKDELVIAGGDFNITAIEDRKEGLFREKLSQYFLVSHQIGCENCVGSHNYRGDWSFLDALLFSKNFTDSEWSVDTNSVRVPNESLYQVSNFGGPARFGDGLSQKGVSDHWPVAADIYPTGKKVK